MPQIPESQTVESVLNDILRRLRDVERVTWQQDIPVPVETPVVPSVPGGAQITVAAANTLPLLKKRADFVCDGTNDQVVVQQAVDLARQGYSPVLPVRGNNGLVYLFAGDYFFSDGVETGNDGEEECWIIGEGYAQQIGVIRPATSIHVLGASTKFGNSVFHQCNLYNLHVVKDFAGSSTGIKPAFECNHVEKVSITSNFDNWGDGIISGNIPLIVRDCIVEDVTGIGISASILVTGCQVRYCGNTGISAPSTFTKIIGNDVRSCPTGINSNIGGKVLLNTINGIITSGIIVNNDAIVVANEIQQGSYSAIRVLGNHSDVQMNKVLPRGGSGGTYGIRVESGATGNFVTNNDTFYSDATTHFSDAGTGTVTVAGNRI